MIFSSLNFIREHSVYGLNIQLVICSRTVIGLIDDEWLQTDKRIDWQPIVNIYCLQCLFSDTTISFIIVPALIITRKLNQNSVCLLYKHALELYSHKDEQTVLLCWNSKCLESFFSILFMRWNFVFTCQNENKLLSFRSQYTFVGVKLFFLPFLLDEFCAFICSHHHMTSIMRYASLNRFIYHKCNDNGIPR